MVLQLRSLIICLVVLLTPSLALAQSEASDGWLDQTLSAALREAAPDNAKSDALDRYPFRFVFLINTAQATNKSAYAVYVVNCIETFLAKRWDIAQHRPKQDRPVFRIAPYQLDLYSEAETDYTLDVGYGKIAGVVQKTRHQRTDGSPYVSGGGSDNVGSIKAMVSMLGRSSDRPDVIIQFTPNPISEWPNKPASETDDLKAISTALVESGFVTYPSPGLPRQTDPPAKGIAPYDVHIWLYGPQTLEPYRLLAPVVLKKFPWVLVSVAAGAVVVFAGIAFAAGRYKPAPTKVTRFSVGLGTLRPYTPAMGETVKVYGKSPESGALLLTGVDNSEEDDGPLFQFKSVERGVQFEGIVWKIHTTHGSNSPVLTARDRELQLTGPDGLGRTVALEIRELG